VQIDAWNPDLDDAFDTDPSIRGSAVPSER